MVGREGLLNFLNTELNLEDFKQIEDAKFNGALTKGAEEVEKIGLCANTTFENIESANNRDLDLVISHHGGWKQFDQDLLKRKKEKIEEADLTWYIAHETLDCAKEFGISWTLAEKLGINIEKQYGKHAGGKVGVTGKLDVPKDEFMENLEDLEQEYEIIGNIEGIESEKIGVIGGGGGAITPLIKKTAEEGCEVFITGSTSFFGEIYAHEKGMTMIKMSETSSERWGVYRLGKHLKGEFSDLQLHKLSETNW